MTAPMTASQPNPTASYARFEDEHWWYIGRRQVVGAIAERLVPPGEGRLAVDIGCGPGANIAALSDRYRCFGVDTAPAAIEFAEERFPQVRFACGVAPDVLGAAAGEADLIVIMDVFEHVAQDRAMLTAIVDAAKPGAHFIITVPAEPSLWSPHDDAVGHLRRYTKTTLAALWRGLPLEPLVVSAYNARLYPLVKTVRTVGRRRGRAHGDGAAEGTDLRLPPAPVNRALAALFGGESKRLIAALEGRRTPYSRGVSLIAALRLTA